MTTVHKNSLCAILLISALAIGVSPVCGQLLGDFEPSSEYHLLLDGSRDRSSKLFLSRQLAAFLVVSEELGKPLLVSARNQTVYALDPDRLDRQPDGTIDLLPGALSTAPAALEQTSEGVDFSIEGRSAQLRVRPPLVGDSDLATVLDYNPDYARKANEYSTDQALVSQIAALCEGVTIRVVYGSWCHVCTTYMPNGVRLQQELADAPCQWDYHGLPDTDPWGTEEVRKHNVRELPTAIVFRGEQRIGSFAGATGWNRPEESLLTALLNAPN